MDSQFEVLTTMGAGAAGALLFVGVAGGPFWVIVPAMLGVGLASWWSGRRNR